MFKFVAFFCILYRVLITKLMVVISCHNSHINRISVSREISWTVLWVRREVDL